MAQGRLAVWAKMEFLLLTMMEQYCMFSIGSYDGLLNISDERLVSLSASQKLQ